MYNMLVLDFLSSLKAPLYVGGGEGSHASWQAVECYSVYETYLHHDLKNMGGSEKAGGQM